MDHAQKMAKKTPAQDSLVHDAFVQDSVGQLGGLQGCAGEIKTEAVVGADVESVVEDDVEDVVEAIKAVEAVVKSDVEDQS